MLDEILTVFFVMLGHFESKLNQGWHGFSSVEIVQSACKAVSVPLLSHTRL
jgi:hypothetical protein